MRTSLPREPVWIEVALVTAVHRRQIAEHGGANSARDQGVLSPVRTRPGSLLSYAEPAPDLAALAAASTSGIVRNDPFIDGNRRTPLVVCRTFRQLNSADLVATQGEKSQTYLALAAGEVSEKALEQWLRERSFALNDL